MTTSLQDAREGVRRAIDQMADACHNATEWNQFPQLGETYLNPAIDAVVLARDAEWRAAVERVRTVHGPDNCTLCNANLVCHESWLAGSGNAALDALLAAMEGR